jgi:hypothetical protein
MKQEKSNYFLFMLVPQCIIQIILASHHTSTVSEKTKCITMHHTYEASSCLHQRKADRRWCQRLSRECLCVRCLLYVGLHSALGLGDRRWVQRPMPTKPASVAWFFSAIENQHFIFSKTHESHLASSVGGREDPKPLSTLQTPPPSLMCQHHHVYITMCMCVSIFTIIFQGDMLPLY